MQNPLVPLRQSGYPEQDHDPHEPHNIHTSDVKQHAPPTVNVNVHPAVEESQTPPQQSAPQQLHPGEKRMSKPL